MRKLKNPKVNIWDNGCGAYVGKNKIIFTGIRNASKKEMIYIILCINGKKYRKNMPFLPIKSRKGKDLVDAVEKARSEFYVAKMGEK